MENLKIGVKNLKNQLKQIKEELFKSRVSEYSSQSYKNLKDQSKKRIKTQISINQPQIDPRDMLYSFSCDQVIRYIKIQFSDKAKESLFNWIRQVYTAITSDAFMKIQSKKLSETQVIVYASKNIFLNISTFISIVQHYTDLTQILDLVNKQTKNILQRLILKYPLISRQTFLSQLEAKTLGQQYSVVNNKESKSKSFNKQAEPKKYLHFNSFEETKIQFKLKNIVQQELTQQQFYQQLHNKYFYQTSKAINYIIESLQQPIIQNSNFNYYKFLSVTLNELGKNIQKIQFEDRFTSQIKKTFAEYPKKINVDIKNLIYTQKQDDQIDETESSLKEQKWIKFQINRVIPFEVKKINSLEFQTKNFKQIHPSLILVMEKWAKQLKQQLNKLCQTNSLKTFFDVKNKQFTIDIEKQEYLKQFALIELEKINNAYEDLHKKWIHLQSKLLSTNPMSLSSSWQGLTNYFCAHATISLGVYVFQYLILIIHSLLKVPYNAHQKYIKQKNVEKADDIQSVYLISFKKVSLLKIKYLSSEKALAQIYKYIKYLSNIAPRYIRIINLQYPNNTSNSSINMKVFFMNSFAGEIELQVASNQNQKQINYSIINKYLKRLQQSQFGSLCQISLILSQHQPLIRYLSSIQKLQTQQNSLYILNNQKQYQTLKIASLNYSSQKNSPFQYYSLNNQQQLINIEQKFKILMKKRQYFKKFQTNDIDKKSHQLLYSILYRKDVGFYLNEERKNILMNEEKFNQIWDAIYQQNKQKITKLSEKQKESLKLFDMICYEAIVCYVYTEVSSINDENLSKLDCQIYLKFLDQIFCKSQIPQKQKLLLIHKGFKQSKFDILFIQQATKKLIQYFTQLENYEVKTHQNGQSIIIYSLKAMEKLKDQTQIHLDSLTKQQRAKIDFNNNTVILFMGRYIFITGQLSSKIDKNSRKMKQLLQGLNILKQKFTNHFIIFGFDDPKPIQLKFSQQDFNFFPKNQSDYTYIAKKTQINLQRNKNNIILKEKRSYLISTCQILNFEITTIKNQKSKQAIYLPNKSHPFYNYLIIGSIRKLF